SPPTEARAIAIPAPVAVEVAIAVSIPLAFTRFGCRGARRRLRAEDGRGLRLRDAGHSLDRRVRMREQRRDQPLAIDSAHQPERQRPPLAAPGAIPRPG